MLLPGAVISEFLCNSTRPTPKCLSLLGFFFSSYALKARDLTAWGEAQRAKPQV